MASVPDSKKSKEDDDDPHSTVVLCSSKDSFMLEQVRKYLTLPMLIIPCLKQMDAKIFENYLNPVMLLFIG